MAKIFLFTLLFMLVLTVGCTPAVIAPTATLTVQPSITLTQVPTATDTPLPTANNTPIPTATNTPIPTPIPTQTALPTTATNQTEYAKYFRLIGLTKQDAMTASTQFKTKDLYCLRHVTNGQITKAMDEIIDAQTGVVVRQKGGIFDGLEFGVLQRGDRSSCTSFPDLKPGKYLYNVYVNDVLVAKLPFEIVLNESYDSGKVLIKLTLDGKYYFVASSNGLDIYNVQSGELIQHQNIPLRTVPGMGYLYNEIQFSADTSRYMVRVSDDKVSVYSFEGKETYSYLFPPGIHGLGGAGLSPNGKFLAIDICSDTGCYDRKQPAFNVIDIETGKLVYEYGNSPGGEARGKKPAFSPDGQVMATMINSQILLWDTKDWKRITDFSLDTEFINDRASFSPDSTLVAIINNISLSVWQVKERRLLQIFNECGGLFSIPQVLFSPNNKYIAVLGRSCQKITVWNISDGSMISEQPTEFSYITGMSLGSDGKLTTYRPKP